MFIHSAFIGGNISVQRMDGDTIYVERELRDTVDDWFYWAFCVEGAAGRTLTFRFPSHVRVGRFGPAISHDLQNWHWQHVPSDGTGFTYTFDTDENKVYFAHNMLYHPDRFHRFCDRHGLTAETLCLSQKGRGLPGVRFGAGEDWMLLTARHHACESTGSYVLEGVMETLLPALPEELSVLVVPFIDYDGVLDGDQGKNRYPHDHNRDYTDAPIYEVVRYLMQFAADHRVTYAFDFHAPWHYQKENDHVFQVHSTEAMAPKIRRFGEILMEETAGLPLYFDGKWDCPPNVPAWNNEDFPELRNWAARLPTIRLANLLEIPYFGLQDTVVSQKSLVALGHAYGRAILRYGKD